MHSAIALSLSFLALAVSAAPARRDSSDFVQVQFSNIVTGANGNAPIPLDGTPISLGQAYADTDLSVDGTLFVTSFEFTGNFQNVECNVKFREKKIVASISDPSQDFETFSETPVNWENGFTISCFVSSS
ncbi:hypothetical protein V8C37DRAFT_420464 [Trichoderma ceciliae]